MDTIFYTVLDARGAATDAIPIDDFAEPVLFATKIQRLDPKPS